jgi:hypothetical protein
VPEGHNGTSQVKGGGLEGENPGERLAEDLMLHAFRVLQGANDDIAVVVITSGGPCPSRGERLM